MSDVIHFQDGDVFWHCPGCKCAHHVATRAGNRPGPVWTWNYSMDKPTLSPSVKHTGTVDITDEERDIILAGGKIEPKPLVCHCHIVEGQIVYCGDCTHELNGQTVACTPP